MKKITLLILLIASNWSYAQNYRFGKVSIEELQEKTYPDDPDANAAVLYVNQKIYYNYIKQQGFVQITEVQKRIKIYNKDGYDWATEEVELRDDGSKKENITGLKAVTYTLENGKIQETKLKKDGMFEERNNKYWKTSKFTMPNVQDGCILEFTYTVNSPYISIQDINLQEVIPIKELDMSVRIPEFYNFNRYINPRATYIPKINDYQISRTEEITTKSRQNEQNGRGGHTVSSNYSTHKWEFKENKTDIKLSNVPALKQEDFVSNLNTYRTKLIWEHSFSKDLGGMVTTYATTWDEVTKTIYDDKDFGSQLKQTGYFENEVSEVIKGATSDMEKMNRIYNFVKTKVKWNDYYGYIADNGVKKAYKEGTGNVADINLMLTAMLRYARINANPMLISTRSNDIPVFPATRGFNYVVAAVETSDDVIILDATDKFATPNVLPVRAINWQGRIIRDSGSSSWYDLSPKASVKENYALNAVINDDLSINGKVRVQLTSFAAKNFRTKYQNYNAEEKLMDIEKGKGEIEVSNYEIKDMDMVDNPIVYAYDYHLKSGIEQIGDKIFITPMMFLAPSENQFKQDTRTYPIDFIYGYTDRYTINIKIPEGFTIESLPENSIVKYKGEAGEFKYIAQASGSMIQFVIAMDLDESLILPDDYAVFKEFYQTMENKQMEKIVLKRI